MAFERGIELAKDWLLDAHELCKRDPVPQEVEKALGDFFHASVEDLSSIRGRLWGFFEVLNRISQRIVCTTSDTHENCKGVKAFVRHHRPPIFFCMDTIGNFIKSNEYVADLTIHEVAHAFFSNADVIYFHELEEPGMKLLLKYLSKNKLLRNADSWSSFVAEMAGASWVY